MAIPEGENNPVNQVYQWLARQEIWRRPHREVPDWYGTALTQLSVLLQENNPRYAVSSLSEDTAQIIVFSDELVIVSTATRIGTLDSKVKTRAWRRSTLTQIDISGGLHLNQRSQSYAWPGELTVTLEYGEAEALTLPPPPPEYRDLSEYQALTQFVPSLLSDLNSSESAAATG